MELININQVAHAIFNIRQYRTLTAEVNGSSIRLSIPRTIKKSELSQYKLALREYLLLVWDSHSGIIVHTYNNDQEEVFAVCAFPEHHGWIGLTKEQVKKAYTTCAECGHHMDAPDNLRFTTIYNHIKQLRI